MKKERMKGLNIINLKFKNRKFDLDCQQKQEILRDIKNLTRSNKNFNLIF